MRVLKAASREDQVSVNASKPLGADNLYRFDHFELQPSRRILLRCQEKLPIAPKTCEVLLCLVQHAGHVVLKEDLLKAVWPDSFVEESNLTQHIFWLRKALGDKSGYIATIPGRGYEFIAKVEIVSETANPSNGPQQTAAPILDFTLRHTTELTNVTFEETTTVFAPAASFSRIGKRLAIAASALAVAAVASWGVWLWFHRVVPGDHHDVVLADFQNSTGDSAFDPALKTLLAIDLNQSPFLTVAGDNDTQTALKLMRRRLDEPLTASTALEVCQRLNDQAVLSGMIASFGQRYLVTLTATDCQTGKSLVQSKAVANSREDVLKSVDFVAAEMRRRLGESLKGQTSSRQPLQPAHTFSMDALRAYSEGLALVRGGRYSEAIPLFQRAIELDPKFAAAQLELARTYARLHEDSFSRIAMSKAYDLRDQGDDLLRLRILSSYSDIVTGDKPAHLRAAIEWAELYPNQPQAWINLSGQLQGLWRFEEAVEPARHAVALAPNNGSAYSNLCGVLMVTGRVDEAKASCQEAIHRNIDNVDTHAILSWIAFRQHDTTAFEEQNAWYKGKDEEDTVPMYPLFADGKAHAAVALWLKNIDRFRREGFTERADRFARVLVRREAEYGMDTELREQLPALDPRKYPLNIVIANAELGRIAAAESALKILAAQTLPTDTNDRDIHVPQAIAAVALARHRPKDAVAALEVAHPYDLGNPETVLMRASAYLAARQLPLADAEFRKIIDHPYIAPTSPTNPLAHLGLARTYALEGNQAAARQEYQTLFTLWKDADSDLPPLQEARREFAKLNQP